MRWALMIGLMLAPVGWLLLPTDDAPWLGIESSVPFELAEAGRRHLDRLRNTIREHALDRAHASKQELLAAAARAMAGGAEDAALREALLHFESRRSRDLLDRMRPHLASLGAAGYRDLIRTGADGMVASLDDPAARLVEIEETTALVRIPFPRLGEPAGPNEAPVALETRDLGDRLALLRIPGFEANTGAEVLLRLRELAGRGTAAVLVDVRGNAGGAVLEALVAAAAFLPEGGIVARFELAPSADIGLEPVARAKPGLRAWSGPVAVLIDEQTAGAAELFAAALRRGECAAPLIGRRSRGVTRGQSLHLFQGLPAEISSLLDRHAVLLTSFRFLPSDGADPQGAGLAPDLPTAESDDVATGIRVLQSELR